MLSHRQHHDHLLAYEASSNVDSAEEAQQRPNSNNSGQLYTDFGGDPRDNKYGRGGGGGRNEADNYSTRDNTTRDNSDNDDNDDDDDDGDSSDGERILDGE